MPDKKNCWDCADRIGAVCMEKAGILKDERGFPVDAYDQDILKKICPCETGKNITIYELKNKRRKT